MRKDIWESMLDADLNFRYWKQMSIRYANYDWYLKVFLAISTSGTVAAWSGWNDYPSVWKFLSGLSALISIVVPLLKWTDLTQRLTSQATQWWELYESYTLLWSRINRGEPVSVLKTDFDASKKKESDTTKQEITLPYDKELRNLCFEDVLASHGLSRA